jgi:hypothetical protein
MKFVDQPLSLEEILSLKREFGDYLKLTVDIENEWLVAGAELHADAEKFLLEKGSNQDDIWGGGINLKDRQIDTTAVLNLRPRMDNDSLEILDHQRREKFIKIVKRMFKNYGPR